MVEKNFSSIGQSMDRLSIFELSIEFSIGTVARLLQFSLLQIFKKQI